MIFVHFLVLYHAQRARTIHHDFFTIIYGMKRLSSQTGARIAELSRDFCPILDKFEDNCSLKRRTRDKF
jgi:hypothetical protein